MNIIWEKSIYHINTGPNTYKINQITNFLILIINISIIFFITILIFGDNFTCIFFFRHLINLFIIFFFSSIYSSIFINNILSKFCYMMAMKMCNKYIIYFIGDIFNSCNLSRITLLLISFSKNPASFFHSHFNKKHSLKILIFSYFIISSVNLEYLVVGHILLYLILNAIVRKNL